MQQTQEPPPFPTKDPIPSLDRSTRLLLGQRGKSKIWLDDLEVGEERLGLVVLYAGVHDNIIAYCTILVSKQQKGQKESKFKLTRHPINRRGNSVLVPSLQ